MPNDTIPNPPKGAAIVDHDTDVQHGAIGNGPGYSGQEYDSQNHVGVRAMNDSTSGDLSAPDDAATGAIPPDNGKRASFDYKTGAVHGSGAGAGGGNEGEDFSSDDAGGDGFPLDQAITDDDEPAPYKQ
jgi:hypothetical protein